MTTPDLSGVEQMSPADVRVRGWLALTGLPPELQALEDSRAAADFDNKLRYPRGFERQATDCERQLLAHLGHVVPDELVTVVKFYSRSCRNRRWPAIEAQESAP